ncbi:metalloprotease [Flavobacteriaceae bacterium AU392]|nr:metalloprotease [Flavobacteriaceae bacterium]RKM86029.1 metalloprotease [Flavobacteriaceae bacterium AU392]
MNFKPLYIFTLFLSCFCALSQNKIDIDAHLNADLNQISVNQTIEYTNTSDDTFNIIYLNDWNHSFSHKKTPLGDRFEEEFSSAFRFAKDRERGFTHILSIRDKDNNSLSFERLKDHPDVIKVILSNPITANKSYTLHLSYNLQIPRDKFTRYGVTSDNDYFLKYWYISPSVYNKNWQYYSNKNLDDLFHPKADISLKLEFPKTHRIVSELDLINVSENTSTKTITLKGKNRIDSKLFIIKESDFTTIETDDFSITTDIYEKGLGSTEQAIITDKITQFITTFLGKYPHKNLLVSDIEAKKDPIYGLNQLPSFIRPFPENFQFELKLLKATLNNYLENTLQLNPRKEQWLKDGIQIYFLMKYVEENYPDMKLVGSLAKVWGLKSFHLADLDFNEQYTLLFMNIARINRDQPLTMQKDSLIKFNTNIANKYKAGIGLKYLDDFVGSNILDTTIKDYIENYKLKETSSLDFETLLKSKTDKDITWFFKDYISTRKKIDFKIKKVQKTKDSITLTIKNKRNSNTPISLFTLNNDSIVSKQWVSNIKDEKTITIARDSTVTKLALNYDKIIPEFNLRDNWKSLKRVLYNKPLRFGLLKDAENPNYNQVFLTPLIEFDNIYDGLTFGLKFSNKTLLRKQWNYRITPQYGSNSEALIGSGTISYTKYFENSNLFSINSGFTGSYSSFGPDLFVRRLIPFINFSFRDDSNLRSNKFQSLNFRYIDITRDDDLRNISGNTTPDYRVFNARYININSELIDLFRWSADLQFSEDFGKLSFNYIYRKRFKNDRQLSIRFFNGFFLYNNTEENSDFFSFALDRPTDYLFDFNYLGRSENDGIVSQQIIIAEGGFKSRLNTPFANQWISTANASTTIWKDIQAYGDIGFVKNKGFDPEFVYDSGIRLNLLTDYFELYFPVYSSLGFELGESNYAERIRFKFTADLNALISLFTRKWY